MSALLHHQPEVPIIVIFVVVTQCNTSDLWKYLNEEMKFDTISLYYNYNYIRMLHLSYELSTFLRLYKKVKEKRR